MSRGIIGMKEMAQIFAVTDDLGIHRERVTVPLEKEGHGGVRRAADGKIEVVVPTKIELMAWISTLKGQLESLGIVQQDKEF
jgi:hypothetical protein